MMKNVFAIAVLLVACSKHEDKKPADKPAPKTTETKPVEKPKPATAPIKAFVELDPGQIPFKAPAVLGKTPLDVAKEFPQYLRKDKTSEAVKKQTDEMMKDMTEDMKKMGIDPTKGGSDIEFRLPPTPAATDETTHVILYTNDSGKIREYGVWFRGTPAEAQEVVKTFDDVWGAHKVVNETLGPRTTWFDPKAGIRASTRLEADKPNQVDVDYVRYLPLAKFFGEPGPVWGFEKPEQPLLGSTVEQLEAAYGKDAIKADPGADTVTLTLPPTDYAGDTAATTILMFLERGKVRQWNVSIPFEDYEPARAEYEAALDAKLGKPKPARHDHLIYGKKPSVDVEYSKFTHELDIEVTR